MKMPERDEAGLFLKAYTAEDLKKKSEEYFESTPEERQTRAGLCVYLGISSMTLTNYMRGTDPKLKEVAEFIHTRLEAKYELALNMKNNTSGPIFALKQYGWRDAQETELKGSGQFQIVTNVPRPTEE